MVSPCTKSWSAGTEQVEECLQGKASAEILLNNGEQNGPRYCEAYIK